MRTYGQACPVARALDLLGERWTLLLLRDLCAGPWRFNELQAGLAGIGPNLLSARLRQLSEAGLVEQVERGYRLSSRGDAVRPLLRELMVFGQGLPAGQALAPLSARVSLGLLFDPVAAQEQSLTVAVTVASEVFAGLVVAGRLTMVSGGCPVIADVDIRATADSFVAATRGERQEGFRLRGHAAALQRFRLLFRQPQTGAG